MSSVTRPPSEIFRCCWPGCREHVYDHPASPPFCGTHLIRCAVFVSETMGASLFPPLSPADPLPGDNRQSVVYCVRLGRHVKIGTTVNIASRMESFRTVHPAGDVELLTTEPGNGAQERQRHREFDAERIDPRRELFNPSPRLLAHIAALQPHRRTA